MTETPETLRALLNKLLPMDEFDFEKAEVWNVGRAHAAAWELVEADRDALRESLGHLLNWAGQRQDALTSRQVADAVMEMCQDALASLPPENKSLRGHEATIDEE